MIKSMTGFAKGEASKNGINLSLEIKSLNSRNLDITCRIPRSISHNELEIRTMIRQKLDRGAVSVNIYVDYDEGGSGVEIDPMEAARVHSSLGEVRKKLKIKEAVKLDHILVFSQYMLKKDELEDSKVEWELAIDCLRNALLDLDKMRKQEGQNLYRDIAKRVKKFHEHIKEIERLGYERIPQTQEKYKEKIAQMFANDEIDESRLQTEIVLMADKLDISEECTRLASHVQLFTEASKANVSSGRKLNFILQEMHREINTIGSKANNTKISHMIVGLKEEIERLREQVQNIE
jgi:uncharacterized protein (TIGR00255 family)